MITTYRQYDEVIALRESDVPMTDAVEAALSCPECNRWLIRGETGWSCWKGHTKIVPEPLLVEMVREATSDASVNAEAVVREFRKEQEREEHL